MTITETIAETQIDAVDGSGDTITPDWDGYRTNTTLTCILHWCDGTRLSYPIYVDIRDDVLDWGDIDWPDADMPTAQQLSFLSRCTSDGVLTCAAGDFNFAFSDESVEELC